MRRAGLRRADFLPGVLRRWLAGLFLTLSACHNSQPATGPQRIVSLSPSITETLFAIGAGERVVGVTDYCQFPAEVSTRTRAGSILQPNYEVIARLQPTMIVGEQIRNSPADRLSALAPTHVLPWLTLPEVVSSIRELGRLIGREPAANELASRVEARLQPKSAPDAPRVLLVVAMAPGPFSEVWYVKRNSLHGTLLAAAGGRNAVDEDVTGAPVLSLEKLIAVNPDVVLLLVPDEHLTDAVRQQYIDAWKALPLKAVKNGAVRVLAGSEVQSTGPRILTMADRLTATLREFEGKP